jgi:hypothetical protein
MTTGDGSVWVSTSRWPDYRASSAAASIVRIDPATGRRVSVVVPDTPGALSVTPGALWLANGETDDIVRRDPTTFTKLATIHLQYPFGSCGCPAEGRFMPYGVVAGAGSMWSVSYWGALARIDPATNKVTAMIDIRDLKQPGTPYFGTNGLWLAYADGVAEIDPATNAIVARRELVRDGTTWRAYSTTRDDAGRIWILAGDNSQLGGRITRYAAFGLDDDSDTVSPLWVRTAADLGAVLTWNSEGLWVKYGMSLRNADMTTGQTKVELPGGASNCEAPVATPGALRCGLIREQYVTRFALPGGDMIRVRVG